MKRFFHSEASLVTHFTLETIALLLKKELNHFIVLRFSTLYDKG